MAAPEEPRAKLIDAASSTTSGRASARRGARAHRMLLASIVVVALAACGDDGPQPAGAPADGPRTIEITMIDIAYDPAEIDVAVGETVTFVFRNDGAIPHEAVFGTLAEQEAHHTEMAEMDDDHDAMDMASTPDSAEMTESPMVVVEPGESVRLNHTFDTAGSTMIGCHEPGHWEAGMRIDIDVA